MNQNFTPEEEKSGHIAKEILEKAPRSCEKIHGPEHDPRWCSLCGGTLKINIELLRESLRIMHWHPEAINFIVAAIEEKKS